MSRARVSRVEVAGAVDIELALDLATTPEQLNVQLTAIVALAHSDVPAAQRLAVVARQRYADLGADPVGFNLVHVGDIASDKGGDALTTFKAGRVADLLNANPMMTKADAVIQTCDEERVAGLVFAVMSANPKMKNTEAHARVLASEAGVEYEECKCAIPLVTPFDQPVIKDLFPHTQERKNKDGDVVSVRLLSTIENLEHMFNEYGIPCAYNEMSKDVDIEVPGHTFTRDNKKCVALSTIKSASHRNGFPVSETKEYMLAIADKHAYHPVRDYILSKPWDGVSRLPALFDTLVVDYTALEMRDMLVKRWLLNAVAAVFSQNHREMFYGVLTLQGEGDAGKTRWFQALVPEHIDGFKEGVTLKPDDKDSVLQANSNWIVELGELDKTTSKTAAGEVKAYLTHTHDELRRAYATDSAKYKRRTVYCATVNPARFLVDDTGNRRFWTLAVNGVVVEHGIDIQQLWAEVYQLYLAGEQWWLNKAEVAMLNASNKDFEIADPMEELLKEHFDFSAEVGSVQARLDGGTDETVVAGTVVVTATSISIALGLNFEGNKMKINPLSAALARLTGKKATNIKVSGTQKIVTGWRLKAYNTKMFISQPKLH